MGKEQENFADTQIARLVQLYKTTMLISITRKPMRYEKQEAVKVFNFQSHSHARSKQFYWTMVDNAYFTPEISFVRGNIPHLANMHSEHENNFQLLNILRASKQFCLNSIFD